MQAFFFQQERNVVVLDTRCHFTPPSILAIENSHRIMVHFVPFQLVIRVGQIMNWK